MVGLTKNTVGKVCAVLRLYCKRDLEDRPIIPFGGNVHVVKCDESQFKHKSKVIPTRKEGRNDTWVFGVVSTEHSPCPGYFKVVWRRNRGTLTQILQGVLLPGSQVHTDDWAAYRNLHLHVTNVTLHRTVVHQNNFVDPLTGIHMQESEAAKARLKYHVKREKGIRLEDLQDFLEEQMWRDWRGLDAVFDNVTAILSHYYPL
ncbi:uncharacterized protein [Montipora foliosa]|uniref:uncharacterized protein n=1 Tax=Montipora foliosa TaxID=591990 RepID=UPI0035F20969